MAALGFCLASNQSRADDEPIIYQPNPDSPIEGRNPNGPPELAQYDFLIGDWDAVITWTFPGQDPSTSHAKWHNHWIINGTVVMQEWRGPQYTGAEIRQWDAQQGKWVGVNIYPDFSNAPNAASAEKVGDKMFVFVPGQGQNGPFINRETYYDIGPDSFKMKSEISKDGGQTWKPGFYHMTVTRAE